MKVCESCNQEYTDDALLACPADGGRLYSVIQQDLVGTTVDGRFAVDALIGIGGMGQVYRAHQTSMNRVVALKVLLPELAAAPQAVKRFLREAKAVSRFNHPNAITVYDFGQTSEGLLYLAMEFVDGQSLAQLIEEKGRVDQKTVCRIMIQVLTVLEAAHREQIIHRDLKPENIMFSKQPGNPFHVKVLDFGLAKLLRANDEKVTATGMVCGTPIYMSPEQFLDAPQDGRADLYSAGVITYEMLTGRPPFDAESATQLAMMHTKAPPPPINPPRGPARVDPALDQLVQQCLAKRPDDRPESALAVRRRLRQIYTELRKRTVTGPVDPDELTADFDESLLDELSVTGDEDGPKISAAAPTPALGVTHSQGSLDLGLSHDSEIAPFRRRQRLTRLVWVGVALLVAVILVTLAWQGLQRPLSAVVVENSEPLALARSRTAPPPKTTPENRPPNVGTATPRTRPITTTPPLRRPAEPPKAMTRQPLVRTTAPIAPAPQKGLTLQVSSVPEHATVWVDGKRMPGKTPLMIPLTSGRRELTLTLRLTGYRALSRRVDLRRTRSITLRLQRHSGKRRDQFFAPLR